MPSPESFANPNMPNWQDVNFQLIDDTLEKKEYENALLLCQLRLRALVGVVEDTEDVIRNIKENPTLDRDIDIEEWNTQKELLLEEINELREYIIKINQLKEEDMQ